MRWFLRVVRLPVALPGAVLLGALSAFTLGSAIAIPVVDVARAFGDLPYAAVLPLVAVVALGALAARASPPAAAPSARAHAALLVGFVLACAVADATAFCVTLWLSGRGTDLAAARNVLGYAALLFAGQAALGVKRAPSVPAVYVFVSTVFGRVRGEAQPWAWPALPGTGDDVLAAALAASAAAVLACASALRSAERFYGLRGMA